MNGRIFQITRNGDIVWEYVIPYVGRSTMDGKPFENSLIYRAQQSPKSHRTPRSRSRSLM
jgi:hypothetical protein